MDTVARTQSRLDGARGDVDINKSKAKAKAMINKGTGIRLTHTSEKKTQRRTREDLAEQSAMQMLQLSGLEERGNAIKMNLLSKSGLVDNRVVRDLNILESSVKEAAHHLQSDSLSPALDQHFGLDNLDKDKRDKQADGCTIAALLMMNAAMLHQRIANGLWLTGVSDLDTLKNDVNVVRNVCREWERIMRHDFRPILEPALETIYAMGVIRQDRRAGTRPAPHRSRGGTHSRNLRRHGSGLRRTAVQPSNGQPGQRRRLLHPPGSRVDRCPPDTGRLRRAGLDRPAGMARTQDC